MTWFIYSCLLDIVNQKGFAHIFLIILLLVGLAVGIYLVQQKTNLLPKAGGGPMIISGPEVVGDSQSGYFSTSPTVEVELYSPFGPSDPNSASGGRGF